MNFVVNGTEWNLIIVEPYSDNLKRSDNTITLGVTDNNTKTICINNRLSDDMFDKVLLHELCHVHAMEYNYSIPIEVEEIVCDFLSIYGRNIIYIADEIIDKTLKNIV